MTTLREAAQQALEAMESCAGVPHWPALQPTITALRKALAQQEQEQEPVAWLKTMYSGTRPMLEVDHLRKDTSTPVYAHPPRREWQGLTDADYDLICDNHSTLQGAARAIEAKLKEKNHG